MPDDFGGWVRNERAGRGWSLRDVERRVRELYGVRLSDTHLSQIETGKRPPATISPRILFTLARMYELDMLDLLSRIGPSAGVQVAYDRQNGRFRVLELGEKN